MGVRQALVCAGLAAALFAVAGSASGASASRWSGSASCTISVMGSGYQHTETQRWKVMGATTTRGSFRFVPSHWTDTGSGSSHQIQGSQTLDITWTVNAAAAGKFQFVVRASDGKLLISQANAQLRAQHGITGTQQQTIGGVAQTPVPVDLEAFETQLPSIVASRTATSVSGVMPSTVVHGSFGPFQPGASTVTKSCTWRFTKAGK